MMKAYGTPLGETMHTLTEFQKKRGEESRYLFKEIMAETSQTWGEI